jgi:hypothetical protein
MTRTQATVALGLIKKTLPDLSSQKVEVTEPVRVVVEYIRQKPAGKPGTKEGPAIAHRGWKVWRFSADSMCFGRQQVRSHLKLGCDAPLFS